MSELLDRFVARASDPRAAVIDDAGVHPYRKVVSASRRIAAALVDGKGSLDGARVAILVPPGADFVASLFGVLLAGGCAVVLSPLHPLPETQYFCEDAAVNGILCGGEYTDLIRPLANAFQIRSVETLTQHASEADESAASSVDSRAPALQLYTSGTTGKPKGAVITHDNLAVQQRLVGDAWGFTERDVLLHSLPLHHMHGLAIALFTALGAGSTARMRAFDARAIWDEMGHATVFMAVPAMYHRLFAALDAADAATAATWKANAAQLRLATSGSAALPVTLAERWRALTGNIPLERFGMTEIGVGITNNLAGMRFPGCVGFPLPTVETRIVSDEGREVSEGEPGELLVRGPSVFSGYHQRPAETEKAFVSDAKGGARWFRTGDTVIRDASLPGAPFRILGRTSVDILKSGGYKLSALEIEEVLREHSAIAEVAVVGVPDEAWGDRVVACVVLRSADQGSCDASTLRAFAKTKLAAYKVPKEFVFVEELPKNAVGKVVKPDLTRRLCSGERLGR